MTTACIDTRPSGQSGQHIHDVTSEITWEHLYAVLKPFTLGIVFSANISSWRGQESDVAQDIMQETLRRCFEHLLKVARGAAQPVYAFEHFMIVIAYNYCRDLQRRERRLVHLSSDSYDEDTMNDPTTDSPSELAIEQVYQEKLFVLVAHEVSRFPEKQQKAILIDQANLMHFDAEPTPLQQAFIDVGIDIRPYQQELPATDQDRTRHAASLYHAYKRLRNRLEHDAL